MGHKDRTLALISAMCQNRGIGINGRLPWRLKSEMAFFTRITKTTRDPDVRNAVIMGRKSWDSIPPQFRPLEGRINVVLSQNLKEKPHGADFLFSSLSECVDHLLSLSDVDKIFVIGGQSIYDEALRDGRFTKMYLTKIHADYDCDVFFPDFDDQNSWREVLNDDHLPEDNVPKDVQEENGITFKYHVYERIN